MYNYTKFSQKLSIRLVVGTAMISILQKLNVDCMTEKRNIFIKRSRAALMFLLLLTHVTSTGHNLKWDHFEIHIAR